MRKAAAKKVIPLTEPKVEKFIRIKEVTTKGDNYEAWQPEIIEIVGNEISRRYMIDKPNLFEYAFTIAADRIDPRNEVPESEIRS